MNSLNTAPSMEAGILLGTKSETALPALEQVGIGKDKFEMERVEGLQTE